VKAIGQPDGAGWDIDSLIAAIEPSNDRFSPATGREMLAKIGRNVILFNQLEGCLKNAVPYIHPDGSAAGADAFTTFKSELQRNPLGLVAKRLAEATDSSDPAGFLAYLRQVVDARNELMHHFFQQADDPASEEGCRAVITWLDQQHSLCMPLLELSRKLAVAVLHSLERQAEELGEELAVPEWRTQ
jgi:hypothetical protein